jgi:DNA helicase-2/ATP-dependent DNA helicase PcrA
MRLISTFPKRSAHVPEILKLIDLRADYPNIRFSAANLLKAGHVNDVLAASYGHLIVNEYQDCSIRQHALVYYAAQSLPTCVLGDPMQPIFGFGSDRLAKWDEEACKHFPVVAELTVPWRWINANAEALGHWLLEVRTKLLRGEKIDLQNAPDAVTWIELDGTEDHKRRLLAARVHPPGGNGRVLIIGDSTSPQRQRQFASQTPGAVPVEAVDLKDLVSFARDFDFAGPDALQRLAQFGESLMTAVGAAHLVQRVESLTQGRARTPPTDLERTALGFVRTPSHHAAVDVLVEMGKQAGARTHRPAVLRACIRALQLCGAGRLSFHDAAIRMREQNRLIGRPLPRRAVGSTLLLKGLEAEVAVIFNADALDSRNLYVAMTRGTKELTICSTAPILKPG